MIEPIPELEKLWQKCEAEVKAEQKNLADRGNGKHENIYPDVSLQEVDKMLDAITNGGKIRKDYDIWLRICSAVWDKFSHEKSIDILKKYMPEEEPGEYSYKYNHRLHDISFGTLVHMAIEAGYKTQKPVTRDDFYAYMPQHSYIFAPTGELWPAASVNSRIPPIEFTNSKGICKKIPASTWLDYNQSVEQITYAPGKPQIINDRLISEGGWINRFGCNIFNLYKGPQIKLGNSANAQPWIDHLQRLYQDNITHIISWLAHRVQRPEEKINHALVLGGLQGIGKDTILEPVRYAIGPWNFSEVSPMQLLGQYNGFVKSVILRISEARDLGDINRYAFYEHLKAYTAAPPDVLRCNEKYIREYSVLNICGVVITTNHKSDGIYIPADDRRHYVAWSELSKDDFKPDYWQKLYAWYINGGYGDIAAFLANYDISQWDAKAPPPKTTAFWDIVDANRAPEDAELDDALDALGRPDAVTLNDIIFSVETPDFQDWLKDRKNNRQIPHRMENAGYVPVRNESANSGLWVIAGKRQVIYAKKELSLRERINAANRLKKDKNYE